MYFATRSGQLEALMVGGQAERQVYAEETLPLMIDPFIGHTEDRVLLRPPILRMTMISEQLLFDKGA